MPKNNSTIASISSSVVKIINNSMSKCVVESKQSQNMNFTCNYPPEIMLAFANSPACLLAIKVAADNPDNIAFTDMANMNCNKCYASGNTQDMKLTINAECKVINEVVNDIHDTINNSLKQKASIKNDSLFPMFDNSSTSVRTEVANYLTKNITTENISESISSSSQVQMISATNYSVTNNTQTMVGEVIFKSLMNNAQFNKAITEIVNLADQDVTVENTNPISTGIKMIGDVATKVLEFPSKLLGSLTEFMKPAIVIVILYFLYQSGMIGGKKSEDDEEGDVDVEIGDPEDDEVDIAIPGSSNLNKKKISRKDKERIREYKNKYKDFLPSNSRLDSV